MKERFKGLPEAANAIETNFSKQRTKMKFRNLCVVALLGTGLAFQATPTRAESGKAPQSVLDQIAPDHLNITHVTVGGKEGDTLQCVFLRPGEYIKKVTVHWKAAIDGIELETNLRKSVLYGNASGSGDSPKDTNHDSFEMNGDQYINSIVVNIGGHKPGRYTYTVIKGITFYVQNKDGTTEAPKKFGVIAGDTATLAASPGKAVRGLWGWTGTMCDCMSIIEGERQ